MGKESSTNFIANISALIKHKTDEDEKEKKRREEENQNFSTNWNKELEDTKQFAEKCNKILLPIFKQILSAIDPNGQINSGYCKDNHERYSICYKWDQEPESDFGYLRYTKQISLNILRHDKSYKWSFWKNASQVKLIKEDAFVVEELSTEKNTVTLNEDDIIEKIEQWILKELGKIL